MPSNDKIWAESYGRPWFILDFLARGRVRLFAQFQSNRRCQVLLFKMLKLFCLIFFVVCAAAAQSDGESGPQEATPGQYPYQAYIRLPKTHSWEVAHSCGATIISNRFVLSTAICIMQINYLQSIRLVVGTIRMDSNITDGEEYALDKIRLHPFFHYRYGRNDIAVLRVNGSISFSATAARPIALATVDPSTLAPFTAITSGWGITKVSV